MQKTSTAPGILSAKRTVIAAAAETAAALVILFAEAVLIGREVIPAEVGKVYVAAALVCASVIGAYIICAKSASGKMIAALLNVTVFEAILIAAGLISGGGVLVGNSVFYQLLCVLAGSITGCILTVRKPKRKKK